MLKMYIYRFGILMGMYMQVVYQMDIVEQIQFFYSPEAVKEKARFVTFSNDNVAINGKPYTVQLLAADTAFFHFFTYPLSGTPMKAPNDVLVTRQFAERVFGKENPIGEKLSYPVVIFSLSVVYWMNRHVNPR